MIVSLQLFKTEAKLPSLIREGLGMGSTVQQPNTTLSTP